MSELLSVLAELSRRYGADPAYVLAGGGNTSAKDAATLWVKPSGVALATIQPHDFLPMDRCQLEASLRAHYPEDPTAREAEVKRAMLAAVRPGVTGRPSVEAILHNLFDATFVVHTHPALVNGMTCAQRGAEVCAELFPEALWVPYTDPGYVLARAVQREIARYTAARGKPPAVVFLQNHGVFVAADSAEEIDRHYAHIMDTLRSAYEAAGVATTLLMGQRDDACVQRYAPPLRILTSDADRQFIVSSPPFAVAQGPLSPDHIVYAKSFAYTGEITVEGIDTFARARGYRPVIVAQPGAVFAAGTTLKNALTALEVAKDAALVAQLSAAFGGPQFMDDRARSFIEQWEVENYRKTVSLASRRGRLDGKIIAITGGAQGFGKGIAECLAKEGAFVLIIDKNEQGAQAVAEELCRQYGGDAARAIAADVTEEASVHAMTEAMVRLCGGVDVFIANAGVLRAGATPQFSLADWELVTKVNYTGYFLCVKYVSQVMMAQNVAGRGSWMDIIQINSKSGLQGSNRNAAYAASKFGTIGMTQSFAKEFVTERIKVNSICPGNYFEGPLWSDPETGLFRQYFDAGKVPGAKSLADVRAYYEAQVPMGRGCLPEDVARAVCYCIEQQYETGQALPVTGGQVMLK
ncbi:MAG: SDR family NAD(P)-dependent oxidoreductase [bacterium]|nr:SDR family NAD(P)-dependent oxidoreductase [bacterium]